MPEVTKRNKVNKPWQKFLDKVNSFETTPVESWTEYQLLGYLIQQVKEKFGFELSLSAVDKDETGYGFTNGTNPSRHPCLLILRNKIINKLHGKVTNGVPANWSPELVKTFIDWSTDKCIKYGGFYSINYIANPNFINEFKMRKVKSQKKGIDRSDKLPENIKKIIKIENDLISLETYGDLAFYNQAYPLSEDVLAELNKIGVDICRVV